jgi:ribosomal-protein-alanine N-acetyltransferase
VLDIRPYRSQDFDELWRIDQQCFAEGIAYSRGELASYIRRSRAFTLIAEQDRTIAAFIVAESDPTGIGHILTIDVRPALQHAGIGSQLLKLTEENLQKQRCRSVLLEVAVNNLPAIAFYKRHGYDVLETIPRYYLDTVDALVMGKCLSRTKA